jgi:nicotinate phosphoribosyltransferase
MLTDFYQLTMMQGYYKSNRADKTAVFDLFYRANPSGSGYAVFAGLEQAIRYIENLRFTNSDLEYLRSLNIFDSSFLEALSGLSFTGEIYALPEGSVMFAAEPIVRVKARLIEAQLIETALLTILNHQSLIATKAARVCYAAEGDPVLEFGLRRAQGPDAGVYGARAAVIGGCAATSNVLAGQMFDIAVKGTHGHSWVMTFGDEYEAFKTYADCFGDSLTLLVDTYNTVKSGVPNAIRVFQEKRAAGSLPANYGIRLDSGDLAYLSKKARKMLDDAGFPDAKITASSDLDEFLISQLKLQGAKINVWGVGTNLITSGDCPSFGGVYKLSAIEGEGGVLVPKLKISENPAKVTIPGVKKLLRFYDKASGKIKADLIALADENFPENEDLTIFDPNATWRRMTLKAGEYTVREMLEPVFAGGKRVHKPKTVAQLREYCQTEKNSLWDEYRRLVNPHVLPVDLSLKLFNLKEKMMNE